MLDSLSHYFTLNYWFDPNPGPPSGLFQMFGGTLAVEFAVLVYFTYRIERMQPNFSPYAFRILKRAVGIAGLFLGVAIFLVIARLTGAETLSMRALITGVVLAGLALAGYFAYFMNKVYPLRVAELGQKGKANRNKPKPKAKSTGKKQDKKKKRK